jgi:hypothetical protein
MERHGSSTFTPDPYAPRNVILRVRWDGSSFVRDSGEPLPDLAEGALATLVVPDLYIADPTARESLLRADTITVRIPAREVWVAVAWRHAGERARHELEYWSEPAGFVRFVMAPGPARRFALLRAEVDAEAIQVRSRADGHMRLEPIRCSVKELALHCDSLNELATRLSERFEDKRVSHSMRALDCCSLRDGDDYVRLRHVVEQAAPAQP